MDSNSNILHIETATQVCSCALSFKGNLVFSRENKASQSHASSLGVFVEEAINFAREFDIQVHAIAVSSGPGSYTGLRIGVSEAKGLSYGLDAKLIAIPTLDIMAWTMRDKVDKNTLLCPMIDARRMEVYTSIYDTSLNILEPTNAKIIDQDSFEELLSNHKIAFFGDGAFKCKEVIDHQNAIFIPDVYPSAPKMIELSKKAYEDAGFEDIAYFEPFYLKDFVATKPKSKVL